MDVSFCEGSAPIWQLIGNVINIIKIAVPIIIVILAMFDLGKAVMSSDDKEVKESQGRLVKRLIFGVVIFFVVTLVQVVFNLVGGGQNTAGSKACWECVSRPGGSTCQGYVDRAPGR